MNNLNIKSRFVGTLGVLVVLPAAVGWMGLSEIKATNRRLETVYNARVVPLKQLKVVADLYTLSTSSIRRTGRATATCRGLKD